MNKNVIYLYDLPKNDFTSAKIAEILQKEGIELQRAPEIHRDINKPFYSATVYIIDVTKDFKKASEILRYFEIDGKPCRGLPYDESLFGQNLTKTNDNCNIFVRKVPKNMQAQDLDVMFSTFDKEKLRPVKSLKISRDNNHASKGFAFVCYENNEDADKACELLCESQIRTECVAVKFKKEKTSVEAQPTNNNLYIRGFP